MTLQSQTFDPSSRTSEITWRRGQIERRLELTPDVLAWLVSAIKRGPRPYTVTHADARHGLSLVHDSTGILIRVPSHRFFQFVSWEQARAIRAWPVPTPSQPEVHKEVSYARDY